MHLIPRLCCIVMEYTLIDDCTNSNPRHSLCGDFLLHDKPDVDDTYSRPWFVNISMAYYKDRA